MNFIRQVILVVTIALPFIMNGQNTYNQKKEYGYNGPVKKAISYMVNVVHYNIPSDTLNYFGKSTMNFTKNGDITTYHRFYDMPNYLYKSKAVFSGSGKNISYKEESKVNDAAEISMNYKFVWIDPLEYEIKPLSEKDSTSRFITLNPDFSINKVIFKSLNFESEEKASYHYNSENQLEKIVYKVTSTENDVTTVKDDVRVIKSVDVFNNATVIYFYEKEHSRFPKSVVFRYYEYY